MAIMPGVEPISFTTASGQATFGEIVGATWDSYIYLNNADAWANARELYIRSYTDRLKARGIAIDAPDLGLPGRENDPAIRAGTLGVTLTGIGAVATTAGQIQGQSEEDAIRAWRDSVVAALADKPDVLEAVGGLPNIDAGTRQVMREADERLSAYAGTQGWAVSLAAQFVGGMAGTLADPIQGPLTVATSLWGVGAAAARSIWVTIARTAVREAAVNAASEAAAQPFVQANRAYAGLEYGFGRALSDIGFAAVIGGGLGAGIDAAARGVRRVVAGPEIPRPATPPPSVIRGAVNAMETDLAMTTSRPVGVNASAHTVALDAGSIAAANPSRMGEAAAGINRAVGDTGGVLETGATRAAPDGTMSTVDVLTLQDGARYVRAEGTTDWTPDAPDATVRLADDVDADARMGAPDTAPRQAAPVAKPRAESAPDETLRAMSDEQLGAFREKVAKQAETKPEAVTRLQAVDAEVSRRASAQPIQPEQVDAEIAKGTRVKARDVAGSTERVVFDNGEAFTRTSGGQWTAAKPARQTLAPGEATGFLNSRAATIDEYRARASQPRPALDSVAPGLGDMPPFDEAEMAAQIADLESLYPDPETIEMPDGSTLADHLAEADLGKRMAGIVSACGLK